VKVKKSVLLAIIGAAALTGCNNEVMKEREYVPAPQDDAAVIDRTAPAAGPTVSDRSGERTAPEAAPETTAKRPAKTADTAEFPPMTGTFDNSGVGADDAAAGSVKAGAGEYIVRRGDTLGKIAIAHRVRLSALMKANRLTDKDAKRLRVGQKLVIPSGKDAAPVRNGRHARPGKPGKNGKREFGGKGGAPALQPGEYIVKAGDTPERIARRAGVRLSALMEANHFTEEKARRLRIGQKIVIPGKGAATVKTQPKKQPAAQPKEQPKAKPEAKPATDDELDREMNSATVKGQTPAATPAPAPEAAPAPAPAPADVATPAPAPAADTDTTYVQVNEEITVAEFARRHGTTPEVVRQLNPDLTGDRMFKNRIYEVPKK